MTWTLPTIFSDVSMAMTLQLIKSERKWLKIFLPIGWAQNILKAFHLDNSLNLKYSTLMMRWVKHSRLRELWTDVGIRRSDKFVFSFCLAKKISRWQKFNKWFIADQDSWMVLWYQDTAKYLDHLLRMKVWLILNDSFCNLFHLDLPKVGQCIKIKSFRWQQSESCQNVSMKKANLYCHPMASIIYIEANFPAGNTRLLRVPTNQIDEAETDIQLDGNNLSICMETLGKLK